MFVDKIYSQGQLLGVAVKLQLSFSLIRVGVKWPGMRESVCVL